MSLKDEIRDILNEYCLEFDNEPAINDIISKIEKRIDKVEQDYKNELNDWGKSQPMKDMWPKQMETLERIRKELN